MAQTMKLNPFSCALLILTIFFGLTHPCVAQSDPEQEQLSAQLAAVVTSKWERIKLDAVYETEEWAGEYRSFDGPTVTTHLAWSTKSGFTVWWDNCSRPGSARVNYGTAELKEGSLRVAPQLTESVSGSFKLPSEFTPVKWGSQHFLIPSQQLIKFVYAANSGSISEIESFLMKVEDYEKQRNGLPKVPPEFTRYLHTRPIVGVISSLGPKVEEWYPTVTLNVGKTKGVVPEMKFYLFRGNHFIVFQVTSVAERSAEASIVTVSTTRDGKGLKPRVGWRVSSRAPKNSWRFMP